MTDKTVKLSKSYTVNGTTFDTIVLREPTYNDIFVGGLGYPREIQPSKGGATVVIYPEVVDAYAQRLVNAPGYEFIGGIGAADAKTLQEAICGFFTVPAISTRSATSLSSSSGGKSAPSSE